MPLPVRRGPSQLRGVSVRVVNPVRNPRPWVRLASVVAIGAALWLLLVPRIAMYFVNDSGEAYGAYAKYAWGRGTSDQMLTMADDIFGPDDPTAGTGGEDGTLTSGRLNCGFVFTSGENESEFTAGEAACSDVERLPLISGIALGVLGVAGFAFAGRLPSTRDVRDHT